MDRVQGYISRLSSSMLTRSLPVARPTLAP